MDFPGFFGPVLYSAGGIQYNGGNRFGEEAVAVLKPRLEGVNEAEVLRYLGHRGGPVPEELRESIRVCTRQVLDAARPRCVYRLFPVEQGQLIGSGLVLEGDSIRRHLEGCVEGVLMAATLGPDVERRLLRTEVIDLARALVLDSVASSAIENVCDNLEADLRAWCAERGLYLTGRFSPGYGDLPLSLQGPLCQCLDTARRIGLTVSASGILMPRKSVTAILGCAPTPRRSAVPGCAACALREHCDRQKCRISSENPE